MVSTSAKSAPESVSVVDSKAENATAKVQKKMELGQFLLRKSFHRKKTDETVKGEKTDNASKSRLGRVNRKGNVESRDETQERSVSHRAASKAPAAASTNSGCFSMKREPEILKKLMDEANVLFSSGEIDQALTIYKDAFKKAMRRNEEIFAADALVRIANIYEGRGVFQAAMVALEKAFSIYDAKRDALASTAGSASLGIILTDILAGIGNLSLQLGDLDEARSCYEDAILEVQQIGTSTSVETEANLHRTMCKILIALKDFESAINEQKLVVHLVRELSGETHPNVADALNGLGEAFFSWGEKENAMDSFRESLMIYRMNDISNDNPRVGTVVQNIQRSRVEPNPEIAGPKLRSAMEDLMGALNLECRDYVCND